MRRQKEKKKKRGGQKQRKQWTCLRAKDLFLPFFSMPLWQEEHEYRVPDCTGDDQELAVLMPEALAAAAMTFVGPGWKHLQNRKPCGPFAIGTVLAVVDL